MLYKPKHIPLIQQGIKTETRRFWKTRRTVPGATHKVETRLFQKPGSQYFHGYNRNLEVYQQKLSEMTQENVEREGYSEFQEYIDVLKRVNRLATIDIEAVVWAIRFKHLGMEIRD